MSDPFRLEDEVALISGGATGIGLGIAQCMTEAGARVVLIGRREDVLKNAVESLGERASFVRGDVTQDTKELRGVLEEAEKRAGGPISILVNNAGINLKKSAVEHTDDEFRGMFETHVFGAFKLTRAVAPGMVQRKRGSILFTASMASIFGLPKVLAYSAAKSAYLGMVRTLAVELSPDNVRVNAIAPGWIETAMVAKALAGDEERARRILQRTPMNRLGDPRDIGYAAVYLCSDAAKFVTGTTLVVDGGASIGF